jgi:hypothetical protein
MVLFAPVASRQGDRLHWGSRGWHRATRAGDPDIPAPERSKRRKGRCAGARALDLDGVQLRWTEGLVRLPWSGLRPEGCCAVRAGKLFPVPSLLRPRLREPAGEWDVPGSPQGAIYSGASRREREHDEALPGERPKGMHHDTYWRLREEHDEAEMEQLEGMREWLDRLEKKVG